MKTFYTERDIEEIHARGVSQIDVNDDVVITDVARERAEKLGISLIAPGQKPVTTALAATSPKKTSASKLSQREIVSLVKARVIARLGTSEYDSLLDQIIPQVMARLNGSDAPVGQNTKSGSNSSY